MYSLWMIPAKPRFQQLEMQISSIADRFRTTAFVPHITLLSQIEGTEEELAKLTKSLEPTLLPLELTMKGVRHEEQFFKCLYYHFLKDDPVMIARQRAEAVFGVLSPTEFNPHLSLAYGNLPNTAKQAVIQKNGFPIGKSHSLRLDQLWLVDTSGPVEKWKKIEY